MSTFIYIAKRSLVATHKAGKQYKINLPLAKLDKNPITIGVQNKSQGGQVETIIHRRQTGWSIETQALSESIRPAVEELLDSIDEGEVFQFDRFGKPNTPKNPVNAKKDGLSYTENRISSQWFSVSFRIIEQ